MFSLDSHGPSHPQICDQFEKRKEVSLSLSVNICQEARQRGWPCILPPFHFPGVHLCAGMSPSLPPSAGERGLLVADEPGLAHSIWPKIVRLHVFDWNHLGLVYKRCFTYLSLVAIATQSIMSAATPTTKPSMMIQSGDKQCLHSGTYHTGMLVTKNTFPPDLPGVTCPLGDEGLVFWEPSTRAEFSKNKQKRPL